MAMILKNIFQSSYFPKMVIHNVQIITKRSIKTTAIDVQIISTEAIKPSSPTPKHLTTYKLSLIDQLYSKGYMPFIFFYSSSCKHQNFKNISGLLKQSLSKALTHYYPFAGRLNIDSSSVACNDHGVAFVETHVNDDISKFLQPPNMELIQQLIPSIPQIMETEVSIRELLSVQVNYFASGEMAIGACFGHGVADGSAFTNFMKLWGEIAREVNANENTNFVLDCTSFFPPQKILEDYFLKPQLAPNLELKRLLFDGKKIAVLKEKVNKEIGNFDGLHASRFAVVSALIWGAYMATAQERKRACAMTYTMNLRNKMNPPINPKSIGNVFRVVRVEGSKEDNVEVTELAREVIKAKRMVSNVLNSFEYSNFMKNMFEDWNDLGSLNFTSMIGMPFYEVDFGWGKPVWFSMGGLAISNFVVLSSPKDNDGIEALVFLFKEEMDKFTQDPRILDYASPNPSIVIGK